MKPSGDQLPVGTLLLPNDYQIRNAHSGPPVTGIILKRYKDKWNTHQDSYEYRILLSNGNMVRHPQQWIYDLFDVVKLEECEKLNLK